MFAVILVPLLPLLASLIVLVGDEGRGIEESKSRPAPSAQLFSAPLRPCGWWRQRGPSPFVSMTLPRSQS